MHWKGTLSAIFSVIVSIIYWINRNAKEKAYCSPKRCEERTTVKESMTNSIMTIYPYKYQGVWVFDDDIVGLIREPFVSGADDIIDKMTLDYPNAEQGFCLIFSQIPFPGHQLELTWSREEAGGNWYYSKMLDMEGWLCPALFKYFDSTPPNIYAQFKIKTK